MQPWDVIITFLNLKLLYKMKNLYDTLDTLTEHSQYLIGSNITTDVSLTFVFLKTGKLRKFSAISCDFGEY